MFENLTTSTQRKFADDIDNLQSGKIDLTTLMKRYNIKDGMELNSMITSMKNWKEAGGYDKRGMLEDTGAGKIDGKDFNEFGLIDEEGKTEAEIEEPIMGYPEVVNAEDTRDYSYKGPYQSRGLGGNRGADGSLLPGQQEQTVDEDMAVSEDMSPFGPGYYKQEGQNFWTRRPDFDYSTLEEKKPQKELDIEALLNLFRS